MEQKHEKPSITALSVIIGCLRAMKRNNHYFSSEEISTLDHIVNYVLIEDKSYASYIRMPLRTLPDIAQTFFFNNAIIPGYDELFMVRKIMVRQRLEEAIANGAEQVVILGGGFDPRGFLASRAHPNVNFFELDRELTQSLKRRAILDAPREASYEFDNPLFIENFHFIACDFNSCSLVRVLDDYGFSPKKQTFLLAEGVTAYLSQDDNKKFLQEISILMQHDDSELLIGYLQQLMVYSVVAGSAHRQYKEQHQFCLAEDGAHDFFKRFNLQIVAKKRPDQMLKGLHDGGYHYHKNGGIRENYFSIKTGTISHQLQHIPEMDISLDNYATSLQP